MKDLKEKAEEYLENLLISNKVTWTVHQDTSLEKEITVSELLVDFAQSLQKESKTDVGEVAIDNPFKRGKQ